MENQKGKKKRKTSKQEIKQVKLLLILGGIFTLLATVGLIWNQVNYNDYKKSDDVRTVEAKVISVTPISLKWELTDEERKSEHAKEYEYNIKYEYDIDGKIYRDKLKSKEFELEGTKMEVMVYKAFTGKYKIVQFENAGSLFMRNLIFYLSMGVGLFFFFGAAIIYFVPDSQPKGKKKR